MLDFYERVRYCVAACVGVRVQKKPPVMHETFALLTHTRARHAHRLQVGTPTTSAAPAHL